MNTAINQPSSPFAGACNFKDWWYIVWITTPRVKLPQKCACCLTQTNLDPMDLPIECGQRAYVMRIPICRSCVKHSKVDTVGIVVALALGLILSACIYFYLFGMIGNFLFLLIYLIMALAIAGLVYWPFHKLAAGKTSACADSGWPIEQEPEPEAELDTRVERETERTDERKLRMLSLEMKKAMGADYIALKFTNREYLMEFIRSNGGSEADLVRIDAAM